MTAPLEALLDAAGAASQARDAEALAEALAALSGWVHAREDEVFDEIHARWPQVQHVFVGLDLSIWDSASSSLPTLAITLAKVNYYRQLDLRVDERFDLLTRVRRLLSPRHHLACARVDLERALVASMRGTRDDIARALEVCDDALASVEQLEDEVELGNALFTRAQILGRDGERLREAAEMVARAREIYARREMRHSLANATTYLADVHLAQGRIPEASVGSSDAIELYRAERDSVGEANALMTRCHTWRARGKAPKALADCEQAVTLYELARLRTSQGRAMLVSAELHTSSGRSPDAQRAQEAAVRFFRESPEAYYLAVALLKLAGTHQRRAVDGAAAAAVDEAEASLPRIGRDRERIWALLEICKVAKDLGTPDRPRIRRCAAQALTLARALGSAELEDAARSFAAFAG